VLAVVGVVDEVPHVGDVGDEAHPVPLVLEPAPEHVEDDRPAGVTQVRVGVDGRPAHVDPGVARHHRSERFLLAGERVVEGERHRLLRARATRARLNGQGLRGYGFRGYSTSRGTSWRRTAGQRPAAAGGEVPYAMRHAGECSTGARGSPLPAW